MSEKRCSVQGCDRKHFGKGLCSMHYTRMYRHGSTEVPKTRRGHLVEEGKSYCPRCRKTKLLSDFGKDTHTYYGISIYCKLCNQEKNKKQYRKNKRGHIDYSLKSKFGITIKEYESILKKQQGQCAICHAPPKSIRHAVDHDHQTRKVRGLLCMECNLGLGKFKHDTHLLQEAVKYLEKEEHIERIKNHQVDSL